MDTVVDVIDEVEELGEIVSEHKGVAVGVVLVVAGLAAVAGAAAGYFIGQKRTQSYYEDIVLPEETEKAKEFYSALNKKGPYETPQAAAKARGTSAAAEAGEAMGQYQGKIPYNKPDTVAEQVVVEAETEVKTKNVFVEATVDPRDWDYNREIQNRTPELPYVISHEEFVAGEEGHDREVLTYYVDDDVAVDTREVPVPDNDQVIGDDNLKRFGHGSHDPNIVYVRNEKLGLDFEIVRHSGSFTNQAAGPEPVIRHSHSRRSRRERGE